MSRFRCLPRGCLGILGILALGLGGCGAAAPPPSPPTATTSVQIPQIVVTDVSTEALTDAVLVLVHSSGAPQYTAFKMQDPPRLVVDISNARLAELPQPIPVTGEILRHIEPLAFPDEDVVRLTLYLQRMAAHTIEAQAQQLRITLKETTEQEVAEPASPSTPSQTAATTPAVPVAAEPAMATGTVVTDVTFMSLTDRSVLALQTSGEAPKVRVKHHQDPLRLLLEVEDARLSPGREKDETVVDPGGAVTYLRAFQVEPEAEARVRVVAHLRVQAAFEVQHEENLVQLVIAKPPTTSAMQTPAASQSSRGDQPPMPPAGGPAAPLAMAQMLPSSTPKAAAPMLTSQVAPSVAPTAGDQTAPAGVTVIDELPPPRFTGEKISLDFQNADINDILRLIAEVSGLNIIAGGDVQGTVTTHMVDVPWDQALDVILKINGLDQERDGNIIRIAPLERFTAERQERLRAEQTQVQSEPTVTQVVPVNYAEASALRSNMERLLSARGSIFIDERTNTLIVTDTRSNLEEVLALVKTLDRQTPQVMIEARIVETTRSFLRELGVRFAGAYRNVTDVDFPNRVDVSGEATQPGNFLVDLPAAVGAGQGGALGVVLAGASSFLAIELSALESSGRGKVVSSPKVATLDNTEAIIQSGQRIPYETVSAEGTQTQFVDASISLKVTPHVTPDGFISMKITTTKNDADFGQTSASGAPAINTREVTTEMLVRDGDTVVIGGLYQRDISSARNGVPGLQDVPVLGWLFHKQQRQDDHDELLVFITPRIIQQADGQGGTRAAVSY